MVSLGANIHFLSSGQLRGIVVFPDLWRRRSRPGARTLASTVQGHREGVSCMIIP